MHKTNSGSLLLFFLTYTTPSSPFIAFLLFFLNLSAGNKKICDFSKISVTYRPVSESAILKSRYFFKYKLHILKLCSLKSKLILKIYLEANYWFPILKLFGLMVLAQGLILHWMYFFSRLSSDLALSSL